MTRVPALALALVFCLSMNACAQTEPGTAPGFAGTYEFVYPHNTADLIENHHIVLRNEGGSLRGWYYGTSDDFDVAREGYLPGFFVAEMQELGIDGDSIHFALSVPNDQYFTKPVPLSYRSALEVPLDKFEKWRGPSTAAVQTYRGSIMGNQITLITQLGTRVFTRSAS